VLRISEGESIIMTPGRIFRAVCEFNAAKEDPLLPSKTVAQGPGVIPHSISHLQKKDGAFERRLGKI